MKYYTFKKAMSLLCLLAAIGFAAAGFIVPPVGEVADSVLILVAQMLTASGTFIGLDVYFMRFTKLLKSQHNQDKDEEV